jgi:hypothetical protein
MSFVGRAAVWGHVNSSGDAIGGNRSNRLPGSAGARLTPLNMMTGSRIAATGTGTVTWADGQDWGDVTSSEGIAPRLAEQLRRPYQQIFEALRGRGNRAPEARTCPRCGQAAHNDWGQAYERLVCTEITSA